MGEHESLATIAGQVAEIRADLATVQTTVAQAMARLDAETGPVMVLSVKVKTIGEKVDKIAAEMAQSTEGGNSAEPSAPRWDNLSPEEEARQLDGLRAWVEQVLRVQYPGYLRDLARCWPNHREALWELGSLQAEWTRVFSGDKVTLADAQWWNERWLPGALNRLRTAIGCDEAGCKLQTRQNRAHAVDFSRLDSDPRTAIGFPGRTRPPV